MKIMLATILVLLVGCSGTLKERTSVCLGFCAQVEIESETKSKGKPE